MGTTIRIEAWRPYEEQYLMSDKLWKEFKEDFHTLFERIEEAEEDVISTEPMHSSYHNADLNIQLEPLKEKWGKSRITFNLYILEYEPDETLCFEEDELGGEE